jgi:folate-binding protein YgfZ
MPSPDAPSRSPAPAAGLAAGAVAAVAPAAPLSAQARAATESVALFRATERACLHVKGEDRRSWLNGLVTCDLVKLERGRATWGLLVEKKGRIETDFYAFETGDALVLALPRDLLAKTIETLDHYLIMEDAELLAGDPDDALWFALGPKAGDLVARAGEGSGAALALFGFESGAILHGEAGALGRALAEGVAELGGAMGDAAGLDALRIEKGVPRFGAEIDTSMYPQEAGIEQQTVAFDKGCYLGQEVVYMLQHRGHVKRKLVALEVDGSATLHTGTIVKTEDGTEVGDVRSAVSGPITGKAAAIAMVKWAQSKPGTALVAGERPARVRGAPGQTEA